MPEDLPFLLREQARDRCKEFEPGQAPDSEEPPAAEEDRLEPGPGQVHQEQRRLQHAAEIAEAAYQLSETEGLPDS